MSSSRRLPARSTEKLEKAIAAWLLFGAALLACLPLFRPVSAQPTSLPPLEVSEDGRHFVQADGTPFFWLGDTAWELFHRLGREEARTYLEDRAEKGFTVIQAVVLAELDGLNTPNPYGETPLIENDPTRPNEAYFEHVDYIVEEAERRGLYIGMLPTWGDKFNKKWGVGPEVFTPENARAYGEFLGERYRDEPIIWILGGDRNPENEEDKAIIRAMAAGIEAGAGSDPLMTYHPRGPGSSSDLFHDAEWLDFNMVHSSHGARNHRNDRFIEDDYARSPTKPVLDGEPRYEGIPVGFYFEGSSSLSRFGAFDVRQAAYWALLSGAAGHTYGNNNIWQMWTPEREPAISANVPWPAALDHPGALQMKYVRRLFTSRPFRKLVPSSGLVAEGPSEPGAGIQAARAEDGSFALVYSPRGAAFTADTRRIAGPEVRMIWYNPRYGTSHPFHTTSTKGFQTFTPPTSGQGQDWILMLEDRSESFPLPGPPEGE